MDSTANNPTLWPQLDALEDNQFLSLNLDINKVPLWNQISVYELFYLFLYPNCTFMLAKTSGQGSNSRTLCLPNFGLTLHVQNTLRAECVLKWEETEVLGNWTRHTKHICPDVQLRRTRPGEADRWWQVKKSTFLAAALPMCRLLCQVLRRKQWLR